MMKKTLKLMLVGAGPHARRTFIPHLLELGRRFDAEIAAVVDLTTSRDLVEAACAAHQLAPAFVWAEPFTATALPPELAARLDEVRQSREIDAVLISTPPEAHKAYAAWALANGLHVFMDKPITTRAGAANSAEQALGIYRDYLDLRQAYDRLQRRRDTAFTVNSHRRFHATYRKVVELIEEVAAKTGCPVTSVHSTHCDGQWRLPSEIVDIEYHGYNQGFGKASHSGYHFFDTAVQFYLAGLTAGKEAETAEIFSTFVHPRALLHQLTEDDYRRLFPDYDQVRRHSYDELERRYDGFGEIDVFADVALRKRGEVVGHLSFHLLHNSFSQRSWMHPNMADLYKANGRVRHELHTLQQGPFQNIQIHSFQAKGGRKSEASAADYRMAGNNHWDIHVFRNAEITGGERYEKIAIDDMVARSDKKLVVEEIKKSGLIEFLSYLRGEIPKTELKSNLDSHDLPPALMSGLYLSHIKRRQEGSPVVAFDLKAAEFLSQTLPREEGRSATPSPAPSSDRPVKARV